MSTFLAGLRSRRWLNVGVFVLGVLAMLVAVATPLYARSSAEHLLDQRTGQRPVYETGLSVQTIPQYAVGRSTLDPTGLTAVGQGGRPKPLPPLTEQDRQQMLASRQRPGHDRLGQCLLAAADDVHVQPGQLRAGRSYLPDQGLLA